MVSDVEEAAYKLESMMKEGLSEYTGKVWIIPSVDVLTGTGVHDLDILVMGYLEDYMVDEIAGFQDIEIKSFCATIEVKSHGADGIYRDGTNLMVKYPGGDKNVTTQSNQQNESLKRFLKAAMQLNEKRIPFVSNIIWLLGIDQHDFEQSVCMPNSNIITATSNLTDLFRVIGLRQNLKNQGSVDAFRSFNKSEIESIAYLFYAKSQGADTMSLRRINLLSQKPNQITELENPTKRVVVLSGHAGTGKTIMLLRAASMLSQKGKRCLFLTYNTALISDLKHTISFMPNDMSGVKFDSMHSFMISILYRNRLWANNNDIESDFIPAMYSFYRAKENMKINADYDYVFVDEAQDWEKPIPDALKYIFRDGHIVIADGVDQFMRSSEHTNWGQPYIPTLRKCLRQRVNLTIFAKLFAAKMGVYWDVEPNYDMPEGRVLIYSQYDAEIHNALLQNAYGHGCKEYDLMLLAPNSMVNGGKFASMDVYQKLGIPLFDGIDKTNRDKIYDQQNADNRESRVYTYESCRGLEAWTTVCLRFHELFTTSHPHDYHEIEYSMARTYMLTLWSLIPLTRAIDTLVLVADPSTPIGKVLRELAEENPDFIIYR